jgi:hypothetical protein
MARRKTIPGKKRLDKINIFHYHASPICKKKPGNPYPEYKDNWK